MKDTVHHGRRQYEFVRRGEQRPEADEILTFGDLHRAQQFLDRLPQEPATQRVLGRLAAAEHPHRQPTARDGADQRRIVASRLARGQLKVAVYCRAEFAVADEGVADDVAQRKAEPLQQRLDWICFKVVDDVTGEPIPKVKLEVTLPDDSEKQGQTDDAGKLRFDGIPSGTCGVTSPLDGAEWETTLAYLELGHKSQDDQPADADPPAEPAGTAPASGEEEDQAPDGPYVLAHLGDRSLAPGEGLEQLAQRTPLTADQLALFNWGTTDSDVVAFVTAEDPAEQPVADPPADAGDDAIPTTVHVPPRDRLVTVPQALALSGLQTCKTHTLRVHDPDDEPAYISLVLYDDWWLTRLPNVKYSISGPGGVLYQGTTDADGALEHGPVRLGYYALTVKQALLDSPMRGEDQPVDDTDPCFLDLDALDKKEQTEHQQALDAAAAAGADDGGPDSDWLKALQDYDEELPEEAASVTAPEATPPLGQRADITFAVPAVRASERPFDQRVPTALPTRPVLAQQLASPLSVQLDNEEALV